MTAAPAQAVALARRMGPRAFAISTLQFVRARIALRHATHVGTARLRGQLLARNQGEMVIGDRVRLEGSSVRIELHCSRGATLSIGEGTFINYASNISATRSVTIGRNCAIGQYAIILDNDYHDIEDITRAAEPKPVVIEDDVWIGARVTILPGSHIGRGSVIGAQSLVRGTIPPYTLAAGVPARPIRSLAGAR